MPTTPEADALPATATLLTADAGTPVSATPDAGSVVPAEPKADAGAPAQDPAKLWYEGKTVEVTIATTVLKAVQTPLPSTIWCSNPYAANGLAVQRWSFARSGDGVTLVRPGFPDQKSREYRNGRFWFWDVAADGSQFSVALDSQSGFAVDYQANAKAPEQDSLLGYTCGFTTFAVAGRWL
jgi:hypothetical protein